MVVNTQAIVTQPLLFPNLTVRPVFTPPANLPEPESSEPTTDTRRFSTCLIQDTQQPMAILTSDHLRNTPSTPPTPRSHLLTWLLERAPAPPPTTPCHTLQAQPAPTPSTRWCPWPAPALLTPRLHLHHLITSHLTEVPSWA